MYTWKSDTTRILKAIATSLSQRVKFGWFDDFGTGKPRFLSTDIRDVETRSGSRIVIRLVDGTNWIGVMLDLTTRELEELREFLVTEMESGKEVRTQ